MESPVIAEETSLGTQTQVFEESTDYSKTATADYLVAENACSVLLDVWPDDECTTETVPEPNFSDDIPNSQQVSAPNCCDEITNSLPILKPDWSDENIYSPHKQGQSYMHIYTNSQELLAPPGADEITEITALMKLLLLPKR